MMDEKNMKPAQENTDHQAQTEQYQYQQDLRQELGEKLREILRQKQMKQKELSVIMDIQQPEVSHLFKGHFGRFSIDKIVQLFNRLGYVVKFQICSQDIEKNT